MADDALRLFHFRIARTLSLSLEVYRELKLRDRSKAVEPLNKLEAELAAWKTDIAAREAYHIAMCEFSAADALWRHTGSDNAKPEPPQWTALSPEPGDFRSVFSALGSLETTLSQFRETIERSLPDKTYETDLFNMAMVLEMLAASLDLIKLVDEKRSSPTDTNIPPSKEPELDDLVTLDQIAPLTGLQKRTLERYLSSGQLPAPDIRGGGGKAHKWFYSNLRDALSEFTQRPLPQRFPGGRIRPTS